MRTNFPNIVKFKIHHYKSTERQVRNGIKCDRNRTDKIIIYITIKIKRKNKREKIP